MGNIPTSNVVYKLTYFLFSFIICLSCSNIQDEETFVSEGEEETIPEDGDNQTTEEPIACEDCTYVVDNWKIDGDQLGIEPGDVICLEGNTTYNNLTFINIKGTKENPVIIKNCGGKVAVVNPEGSAFGMKFQYSSNFKLLGNGGGGDYGIKISTSNGFFLTMQTFTTDFEIAHVEIAGKSANRSGFAGMGIKTSSYEDCDLFTDSSRNAWIMENIVIRDNYIRDVGGEGMYIGHGFYNGRTEQQCAERTYSHSIKHIRVYNNVIKNTGLDGIQIKNCDEDVAVYNNTIEGYAKDDDTGAHDEGLLIGDGTTGKFYNNTIINGGTGIMVHGMGNLDIYNNLIIDAHDYAFFAASGPSVYRFPDGYFNIYNNTFHSTGTKTFAFFDNEGGPKRLRNNIFIAPNAEEFVRNGATLDSINNIFKKDAAYFKFVDYKNHNFRLSKDSPAIDMGSDLSNFGIKDDIEGISRPQGEHFDIGAFEYKIP